MYYQKKNAFKLPFSQLTYPLMGNFLNILHPDLSHLHVLPHYTSQLLLSLNVHKSFNKVKKQQKIPIYYIIYQLLFGLTLECTVSCLDNSKNGT